MHRDLSLSKERGRERLCYNHPMSHIHNLKYLHDVRINLRKEITPQEKILWQKLRNSSLGYRFRRQHSIGNFIADFYCATKKLAIELDGSQHLDNTEYDQERTNYFESL